MDFKIDNIPPLCNRNVWTLTWTLNLFDKIKSMYLNTWVLLYIQEVGHQWNDKLFSSIFYSFSCIEHHRIFNSTSNYDVLFDIMKDKWLFFVVIGIWILFWIFVIILDSRPIWPPYIISVTILFLKLWKTDILHKTPLKHNKLLHQFWN